MVPPSIKNNLASLRYRERLLTLVWGAACWLSIVLVLLLLCGLVDWLIDQQRETPFGVRLGLAFVQLVVASIAGLLFVLWPQIRRLPDALLALWVESKIPQFQHRLISAVQLNQPDARLDGMSKELVGVVTREAEKLAQRVGGFAKVADHGRLKWTAFVLVPVVVLSCLPFAIWPQICFALLARQMLVFDVEVPHSVKLESISKEIWPVGDDIDIYYRVKGEFTDTMEGTVYVRPEGQPGDTYPLKFVTQDANGAIFKAEVKPSSVNILYSARLADGRTKLPSEMRLIHRPVVTENQAWVRLPAYCGLRPARQGMSLDDRRYEKPQGKGDVVGIPGSSVRVQFEVASLQHQAWLVLLETESDRLLSADAVEKLKFTAEQKEKYSWMEAGRTRSWWMVGFKFVAGIRKEQFRADVKSLFPNEIETAGDRKRYNELFAKFQDDSRRNREDFLARVERTLTDEQKTVFAQVKNLLPGQTEGDPPPVERERAGKIKMTVKNSSHVVFDGSTLKTIDTIIAETSFDLDHALSGYRLLVKDENKFENVSPPRRTLQLVPEAAPTVSLLRVSFADAKSPKANLDVEGLPVVIGKQIPIPYVCFAEYGLGKAMILYRKVKKDESGDNPDGDNPDKEEDWIRAPIPEIPTNPKADVGVRPVGADGEPLNLDFETGTLKDWVAEGKAFEGQPIKGDTVTARRKGDKSNHQGDYWIGGAERHGEKPQGTLTSVPFKITHSWASFLVGGGSSPDTCVELVLKANNEVFFRASGMEDEMLRRVIVDLRPYRGQEMLIRLVDKDSGAWGHINYDAFHFHAQRPGGFDTKTGVFEDTEFDEQIQFHVVPSLAADLILGRTRGGGRYFLETDGLLERKDGKLQRMQLKAGGTVNGVRVPGDLIEYCVEVYAVNHKNLRDPKAMIPVARSETRVSEVMTAKGFDEWLQKLGKEHETVRELEKNEKKVLNPK